MKSIKCNETNLGYKGGKTHEIFDTHSDGYIGGRGGGVIYTHIDSNMDVFTYTVTDM